MTKNKKIPEKNEFFWDFTVSSFESRDSIQLQRIFYYTAKAMNIRDYPPFSRETGFPLDTIFSIRSIQ
jgi:hypothetical protein